MSDRKADWLDIDARTVALETQALNESVESVVKAHAERMEKELLGALRAGYDYLHVYRETGELGRQGLTEALTFTQYVFPAYSEQPPSPDGLGYEYTYELTSVPDHVIRAAMRGELDKYERINSNEE